MPLYPYRCTKCGHRFEKIQTFSAAPETACPKCGGPLERPLTAPGLQFKGAGWYVNDYSRSGSSSSSESSESKPAESKPAAETKSSSEAKTSSSDSSSSSSAPAKSDSSKT